MVILAQLQVGHNDKSQDELNDKLDTVMSSTQ